MNPAPMERRGHNQIDSMVLKRAVAMQLTTGSVRALEFMSYLGVAPDLMCRVLTGSALRADVTGNGSGNAASG